MLTSAEIRQKFLEFMKERGHAVVPSSSLIPTDNSVLLTTAGMQQFKPYYTGEADPIKDFGSKNTASIQKSFRTSDIDEVGDETHLTFFEMLGNFSFGGYFKEEAISLAHEFITKVLGLKISFVSIFEGLESVGVPKDDESKMIWLKLDPNLVVKEEGMADVFWGPTGSSGPCGPTTEIYCKNVTGEDVEIWNLVFNQYFFAGSRDELLSGISGKKLESLKVSGVDTGMGLERLAMISQNTISIFETDLFKPLLDALPKEMPERIKRIFADHARAAVFLISDGVLPSNKGAGYILRRLLRRAMVHGHLFATREEVTGGMIGSTHYLTELVTNIVQNYVEFYPELKKEAILSVVLAEDEKFHKTMHLGLKELGKLTLETLDAKSAFKLYESYGLPYEVIKELDPNKAKKLTREGFEEEFKKHQEISRAGLEKKFGGHGLILDTGELKAGNEEELKIVTRLHTATHMLHRALREVLGSEVHQAGSDITAERTRFDFTFPRKLTPEEIKKIEMLVNEKIKEDLPMQKQVLPKAEAEKTGALYFFKEKYPDPVNVYFIGKDLDSAWSKEFCGGPHVTHTGEIGHFKILKEEAVSSGVRRLRGVVE